MRVPRVQARDYARQRNDPSITLEDIVRLPTWQVNNNKNTHKNGRTSNPLTLRNALINV